MTLPNAEPASPRRTLPEVFVNAYHRHLDECAQCRGHPMEPCQVGAVLLRCAAMAVAAELEAQNQ